MCNPYKNDTLNCNAKERGVYEIDTKSNLEYKQQKTLKKSLLQSRKTQKHMLIIHGSVKIHNEIDKTRICHNKYRTQEPYYTSAKVV